jgi:hypothetical protein
MNEFVEGDVVICGSGQAGSLAQLAGKDVWVLLQNGDIWVGQTHAIRLPQDKADLESCPLNVEKVEKTRSVRTD